MRAKIVGAAASLLSVLPATSLALGLGEIHLRSRLNAPLDAEIDLVGAAPEDLPGLNAQLASRETFARYGLDYPAFLSGVSVRAVRTADGRQVIQVRSSVPVTEPFATLLVEATWPRGRITREYTVLLDPPVFAAPAAAPAPVAAPVTTAGERAGAVSRPAPQAASVPPPPPAVQQAVAAAVGAAAPASAAVLQSGTYTVQPGDTVSRIVSRVPGLTGAPRAAAIVSLYRQNPQAFDGNVNLLRAGSILRLPDQATLSSLPAAEAEAELRRQAQEWQTSATSPAAAPAATVAPAADAAALRLVPPAESSAPRSATAGGQGGSSVEQRLARLEAELTESRRLLSLRDAELSRLRQAVDGGKSAAVAPTPAATPAAPPSEAPSEPVDAPAAQAPVDAASPAPAPVAAPATTPAPAAPAAAPAEAPAQGIVAWVVDHWYYPAGIFVLLGGLLGLRAARRREEEEAVVFETLPEKEIEPEVRGPRAFAPPEQDFGGSTLPLRSPNIVSMPGTDRSLLDDIAADAPAPAADVQLPSLGSTGEFATVGDPLVEADWNISYGLYDQAADQLLAALEREPSRRDLKAKLLEVWFRSDDAERFLDVARELVADREAAPAGEWEKILIMGRQLAPADPLFSDNEAAAGLASIDLNLEGGQNRVDFDVLAEPTRTSMAPYVDVADTPEPIEFPSSLGDDTGEDDLEAAVSKTMEQPRPDPYAGLSISDTAMMPKADRTTEVSIDDLDLDMALDDLASLDGTGLHPLDDSQVADMLDASSLMPQMPGADLPEPAAAGIDALDSGSWRLAPEDTLDPSAVTADAAHGMAQSSRTAVLPTASLQVTDRTSVTGVHLVPAGGSFDTASMAHLSALDPSLLSPTERVQLEPIELPTLEPATLSEVGTKIDLARAYMDMGDPEGARSILAEVVNEGSASQKQEAERLLAALPG